MTALETRYDISHEQKTAHIDIQLSRSLLTKIRNHAKHRDMSANRFLVVLLEAAMEGGLVDAILDDGSGDYEGT